VLGRGPQLPRVGSDDRPAPPAQLPPPWFGVGLRGGTQAPPATGGPWPAGGAQLLETGSAGPPRGGADVEHGEQPARWQEHVHRARTASRS